MLVVGVVEALAVVADNAAAETVETAAVVVVVVAWTSFYDASPWTYAVDFSSSSCLAVPCAAAVSSWVSASAFGIR